MSIYDRIDESLKKSKKTRADLCKNTGISYSTLSSLFQRKSKGMSIDIIRKIAEYLKVSVDYLVNGAITTPLYLQENDELHYSQSKDELQNEIIRISGILSIKNKTKLLSYAYELESSQSK